MSERDIQFLIQRLNGYNPQISITPEILIRVLDSLAQNKIDESKPKLDKDAAYFGGVEPNE